MAASVGPGAVAGSSSSFVGEGMVGAPDTPVQIVLAASANISANAVTATTAQLTAPAGKTTSNFSAGKISDDTNPVLIDIAADFYTEIEWCIEATADAILDDYQFRVVANGIALDVYTVTPVLTLTSSGGTTYLLSVGGTLSMSGVVAKQDNKLTAGTLTPSGLVSKQSNKLTGGTLAQSGLLTKQSGKLNAGVLGLAGAIINQINKLNAGALGLAGAIRNQPDKVNAGTLGSSGGVIKQINKALAGTLTTSGAVAVLKVVVLSVGGTLGLSGLFAKQPSKVTGGTLPTTGTLAKQINKQTAGTLNGSGAFAALKTVVLNLAGTLGLSGVVSKQIDKQTAGALGLSGGLLKTIHKLFSGVLNWVGSFIAVPISPETTGSGFSIDSDRRFPVMYMMRSIDVKRTRAHHAVVYVLQSQPVLYLEKPAPILYGQETNAVYYEQRNFPVLILDNRTFTSYAP